MYGDLDYMHSIVDNNDKCAAPHLKQDIVGPADLLHIFWAVATLEIQVGLFGIINSTQNNQKIPRSSYWHCDWFRLQYHLPTLTLLYFQDYFIVAEKMHFFLHVATAALFASELVLVAAQGAQCFSLKTSTACGEFSGTWFTFDCNKTHSILSCLLLSICISSFTMLFSGV